MAVPKIILRTVSAVLFIGSLLIFINLFEIRRLDNQHLDSIAKPDPSDLENVELSGAKPKYWMSESKIEASTHLKHIIEILERVGFVAGSMDDWDLLWSHDYPFIMHHNMIQKITDDEGKWINHLPGSGYITTKVSLVTSDIKNIPKAFKMPSQKAEFQQYSQDHPNLLWVQKSNNHRGIKITDKKDLKFSEEDTFIQQFIDDPLLIDGRRFDIGVYVVATSVEPLRVYVLDDECLARFCTEPYLPFDPENKNKYVIGDDYTPVWEMSSLRAYYNDLTLNFKLSLNTYLKSQGKDADKLWADIYDSIRSVYESKQSNLIGAASNYKAKRTFFELVRFDFIVDKELKVFLMEVNMSPNLSSAHFIQNGQLYEHVIFSLFSLIGLTQGVRRRTDLLPDQWADMMVSDRDLSVFPPECSSSECINNCNTVKCRCCARCLSLTDRAMLKDSYNEHLNRRGFRRVIPGRVVLGNGASHSSMKFGVDSPKFEHLTSSDQLLNAWFWGKCKLDMSWCA